MNTYKIKIVLLGLIVFIGYNSYLKRTVEYPIKFYNKEVNTATFIIPKLGVKKEISVIFNSILKSKVFYSENPYSNIILSPLNKEFKIISTNHLYLNELSENQFNISATINPIILGFWEKDKLEIYLFLNNLLVNGIIGIVFMLSIIALYMYIKTRIIYFILYTVQCFLYILAIVFVLEGIGYKIVDFNYFMLFYKILPILNINCFLGFNFFFLNSDEYLKFNKTIYFKYILFSILLIYLEFIFHNKFFIIFNYFYVSLGFILTISISFKKYLLNNSSENKLLFFSYLIWLCLVFSELLYVSYSFPKHIYGISYISYAILLETLIFAYLVINRFFNDKKNLIIEKNNLKFSLVEFKNQSEISLLKTQQSVKENILKDISAEIHDNILQRLFLTKLRINENNFEIANSYLSDCIDDLRALTKVLNNNHIVSENFIDILKFEISRLNKSKKSKYSLKTFVKEVELTNDKKIILFRAFQEIIQNIEKHSNANKIEIRIDNLNTELILEIEDNGIGFDLKSINSNNKLLSGSGIKNISKRVEQIFGKVIIKSKISFGTRITIIIPL